jgi:hypothetical protein
MRIRSALLCAVLVLLLELLPTQGALAQAPSVAPLPPVQGEDQRFGIVQAAHSPQLAANAGATWERVIFPWSLIQKDSPKEWNEAYFTDQQLRAQAARGETLVGVIIYTPQWASPDPPRAKPVDIPRNLNLPYDHPDNYWGQFVRKLAERERGVVDHWVIWNEPDLYDPALRYTFSGSYEEYLQLLKVAYLNIKEVNPQAKVVLAGLSYWWDKEYARTPYLLGLMEVLNKDRDREKYNNYFDIVAVHTYGNPLNSYTIPMLARQWLESRGVRKPIWITESNVVPYNDPIGPLPSGHHRATLDEQASYVIQSFAMGIAAGVERQAVYKMLDEESEDGNYYGLVRNNGSTRPAYTAYQVASSYFKNVISADYEWPGLPGAPSPADIQKVLNSNVNRAQFIWPAQVSRVVMERGDRRTTVLWNNSPAEVETNFGAESREATLITKYGQSTPITPRNGQYYVTLPGSTNNSDPDDPTIILVGGDPMIIDEPVAPIPTRARSRIEAVWPHDGKPIVAADQANVSAQLLLPGTSDPVPCRWQPAVELWGKFEGSSTRFIARGVRRYQETQDLRYTVWDFNDVDVAYAKDPEGRRFIEFQVAVNGVPTEAIPWNYGGPDSTDPTTSNLPARSCA